MKCISLTAQSFSTTCRPLCGGRGLKYDQCLYRGSGTLRRPLCGGRGLKSVRYSARKHSVLSPPVRGAWVEIPKDTLK